MVAETRAPVPWTKPDELILPDGTAVPSLGSGHSGGFHVLFADGSARFLRVGISEALLRSLLTRDGGEVVSA
jgi:prepilin-type processing-associated H-X9-DG protein